MKEENIIPIAHLFTRPVRLSFTGINLIMPNRMSIIVKVIIETNSVSNGTIVLTKLLSKIEINTQTQDAATQAHAVCPPIGTFANAKFIECSTIVARVLQIDENKTM